MTPTDLVTHRSGSRATTPSVQRDSLAQGDGGAPPVPRAEKDFRTDFQYNNAMFLTAGYLVEQVTGTTWEDAVRARVFARSE